MFFFFNPRELEASATLKELIKSEKGTYADFSKKSGVSVSAITQFVGGRPLTPALLSKMVGALPEKSGRRLIRAHLRDEIRRAGMDPNTFSISERQDYGVVFEQLSRHVSAEPARLAQLVELMANWRSPTNL